MNILGVRKLIADALEKAEGFEKVFPLGNVVYVHVDDQEYEVVIRTVRPEPRWYDKDETGPLAQ